MNPLPDYLLRLRDAFPNKTEPELELMCSGSLQLQHKTGFTAHEHRRRGMERLFPARVWHEWREDRIKSVQHCLENRIQELMWIGSSNSNKTGDMADIALTLWWTKPENTSIYIASPYETATETGIWAEIQDQFNAAKAANSLLPGKIRHSDNSIVLFERNPRSFIRVATVDAVGKLVGKKSRDPEQGLLVLILDELPAFTPSAQRALMSVMPNLVSNQNLLVIGAGNFANVWDALGAFTEPDERDIPGGFSQFDPNKHLRWRTKRGGLCLRFDGLQSPNVKAGKDLYKFLTTIEYIGKLAAMPGGLESPEAMRFVRSAPVTSLDEFTVTNGERIRAGGALDAFEWTGDRIDLGGFIDPGFGGDACVFQEFQLGFQRIAAGRRKIINFNVPPFYIPVRVGLKDENGKDIPVEDQIIAGAKARAIERRIPLKNLGFDGSLRAAIVQKFAAWSLDIVALDSQGAATERIVNAQEFHDAKPGEPPRHVTWREKVDRLLSELWFAGASLIDSLQLKGLQNCEKAQQQLTTRRWSWSGKKRKVQTKQEYKDELKSMQMRAESPNEADALIGCIEMARRMGLDLDGVLVQGGAVAAVLEIIRRHETMTQIRSFTRGSVLPTGQLHAISRNRVALPARLHRR